MEFLTRVTDRVRKRSELEEAAPENRVLMGKLHDANVKHRHQVDKRARRHRQTNKCGICVRPGTTSLPALTCGKSLSQWTPSAMLFRARGEFPYLKPFFLSPDFAV